MHVLERICIFCLRMCIMSQSQLRESASVFPHRVFSGVRAVFWRFCQCLDSQTFVLFCRPDEASPYYERAFPGQPKSLFRTTEEPFPCGDKVLPVVRRRRFRHAEEPFRQCREVLPVFRLYYYTYIIHIRQLFRSCFTKMFCHDFLLSADV